MRDILINRWREVGDKIVALAEEFPDEAFDERPAQGVRSFGDQLRHVAFWNDYAGKTLRREEADGDANELPAASYPRKADVVQVLKASFDGVRSALDANVHDADSSALDTVTSFVEHNGEHYGQLVMYYRLRGMVPPASR